MKKLLVIRNDKIGDFTLCFPAFALLKRSMPNTEIVALVPRYTAPLAELCPFIDRIIMDCVDKNSKVEQQRVLQAVRSERFDAVISFVSNWYNAKLTWRSGIPYRLAPATKLFQFCYNHRLSQRRSRSEKAEFEYNADLARRFLADHHFPVRQGERPFLAFSPQSIIVQKQQLAERLKIDLHKKWLFVHASTGGSATNLSLEQYAELIKGILSSFDCHIILTAGPGESEKAQALHRLLQHPNVAIYDKNEGLADFCLSLACADLFIAGSTGPLHICGALNIATIGFYPSRRSALPCRWQPLNDPDKHIAFMPPSGKETEKNLTLISIPTALNTIIPFIQTQWGKAGKVDEV